MRSSRLLATLLLLQTRQRLTARELAEEFEVTERTIYRDIDALSAAGVPVYGDRGPGGGFALIDGYRTKLTGLDRPEASALLLVGLPQLADALGMGPATVGARRKLLATLSPSNRDDADRIGQRFHVDTTAWYQPREPLPHLPALAQAVFEQRVITIRYQGWKRRRKWTLEPLGIVFKTGHWYLVGKADAAILTFNVASVLDCSEGEERFVRPADFDLADYWAQSNRRFESALKSRTARLMTTGEGRRRLVESGMLERADAGRGSGRREVAIAVEADPMAARQLLFLGDEIEVLAPRSLRSTVADLAKRIGEVHRSSR